MGKAIDLVAADVVPVGADVVAGATTYKAKQTLHASWSALLALASLPKTCVLTPTWSFTLRCVSTPTWSLTLRSVSTLKLWPLLRTWRRRRGKRRGARC